MRRLFHSSHPTTHDTQRKAATTVTGGPNADLIRLLLSQGGIPAIAQRTVAGPLTWRGIARPIFVNEPIEILDREVLVGDHTTISGLST